MKTPISIKKIVNQISVYQEKLDQATLSQEELQDFQNLATLLHERLVILNYKAKEALVFERSEKEVMEQEQQVEEPEARAPKNENQDNTGILFDFSAPTVNEDVEKVTSEIQDLEEEKTIEKEEFSSEEVIIPDEVEEVESAPSEITATRITEIKKDDVVYSFYERFSKLGDDSVMGMLSGQKIDSLSGAFGLNDRLQFINELFKGDTETFNSTVQTLDNQTSKEEAKIKLSEIAAQHQWEPDDILVEDFAKLVHRRYAE